MIIDDSDDMRELLKLLLNAKGFQTELTADGAEALRWLTAEASQSILPDLILLDLRMPVMNGYEFLAARAAVANLKDIPVVIMSGDDDTTLQSVGGFCSEVLIKPLNIGSVVATVERNFNWPT